MLYDEFYKEGKSILDYWIEYGFKKNEPLFWIFTDKDNTPTYEKGAAFLISARALWAFSEGYIVYGDKKYLDAASRAYEGYKYFFDEKNGGYFKTIDCEHMVSKKIYDHAFGIYGLVNYYKITKNEAVLKDAFYLFDLIEKIAYDREDDGYFDTYFSDWEFKQNPKHPKGSVKDMNPMLHIHEAYTALYEVSKNESVYSALLKLTRLFLDKIYNKETKHLNMFFDKKMRPTTDRTTCGHDIETSWLMWETAEILSVEALSKEIKNFCIELCESAIKDGTDNVYGGFCDYLKKGEKNKKVWWEQAEAVIGAYNCYQLTGDEKFKDYAIFYWENIKKYFIAENGEWYQAIIDDTLDIKGCHKISPTKCPYHNFRMCSEMMKRLKS